MNPRVLLWVGFNVGVLAVLALDLGMVRHKHRALRTAEAIRWTLLWVAVSAGVCALLWSLQGRRAGMEFLTGYVIEYALSVDNLFVFLLVFEYFRVKPEHEHEVLFWGVLGAFVMRAGLILVGTALVRAFEWLLYLFGAFLIYTAVKLLRSRKGGTAAVDPGDNPIVRTARRFLPMTEDAQEGAFTARVNGRLRFTPLFLVLLVVEISDLLFALDSIPAVLGVSQDAFILYSSNVCAVLGLRSLFFVLSSLIERLRYLREGLAAVLAFVGLKMLLDAWLDVPVWLSLVVIVGILLLAVVASALRPKPG